ncbi:hypothetical protein, partial [Methylobacterium brachythecii]|uniref:hypothetical protein n=1 Tax=Methylobacterium brachythecii TaxID=1176177 RepID=UPI0024E0ABCB
DSIASTASEDYYSSIKDQSHAAGALLHQRLLSQIVNAKAAVPLSARTRHFSPPPDAVSRT